MFTDFFYLLRQQGIPVKLTNYLNLHKAFALGLVNSIDELYVVARAILVKSERYFDTYDLAFAHYFKDADLPDNTGEDIEIFAKLLLEEWLTNPQNVEILFNMDADKLQQLSPDELLTYFKDRLKEQQEAHHGGNRWIGTGGTSPVGHSGFHTGGMRVGGKSGNKSAIKVAMDRRYKDYSTKGPLTQAQVGEALKRLRHMIPEGPKDQVNIQKTIYQTMKNAGDIEIVFERNMRDKLKVILAIDNGGWSMEPYVSRVQTLFDYASNQFKDLQILYFHNTIYSTMYEDAARIRKPVAVTQLLKKDPQTRFIVVGDASMAPYELLYENGGIYYSDRTGQPSIELLKNIADWFHHIVWLNPVNQDYWMYTDTIHFIADVFPMYPLTLDGLDLAINHLMQ